jgi:hypothetical protein
MVSLPPNIIVAPQCRRDCVGADGTSAQNINLRFSRSDGSCSHQRVDASARKFSSQRVKFGRPVW